MKEKDLSLVTRIVIADDNLPMLDSVAEILLDANYDVVGAVSDGSCVLAQVERTQPDIVVLDISMGHTNGLELARALQERSFSGKVIFLTIHEDQELLSAALSVGAYAYVVKSRLDLDLLPAIQAVMSGQCFVSAPLKYH